MRRQIAILLVTSSVATSALAGNLIVYPANGQSPDQQRQDQAQCQVWATDTTGVDPVAIANSQAPAQQSVGGERTKGLLGGAAGGAIIGAIAGDAGKGAAIGAGVGVLGGQAHKDHKRHENEEARQHANANRHQLMQQYNRAFKACMDGRGYTVS